jgi:membrane fusion protein
VSGIFRKQAILHASRRLDGEVLLGVPISWRILAILLGLLITALATFASLVTYSRKEEVRGWLVPQAGIIRIQAQEDGIVERLATSQGKAVRKGDSLGVVRMSGTLRDSESGDRVSRSALDQSTAEMNALQARLARIESEQKRLLSRSHAITLMLDAMQERTRILEKKRALATQNHERAIELNAQGFISQRDLDLSNDARLAAEADLLSARQGMASLLAESAEVKESIASNPILMRETSLESAARQAVLSRQYELTTSEIKDELQSPITGTVVALPVQPGQAIAKGSTIALLTPAGSRLDAELFVPTRAAGFIKPGMGVRLQYDAFPFQKFGTARGIVTSISDAALLPDDVSSSGAVPQEPFFKVRVRLEKNHVNAYRERRELKPGMLVSANIIIERRSLLEWVLDPLYAVGKRQ